MKPKFKKMTAAQKRVAIAKDVLKQLKMQRLYISRGTYAGVLSPPCVAFIDQPLLKNAATHCFACAAGSLILSGIRLFNGHRITSSPLVKQLQGKWFSNPQLAKIEAAFEKNRNALAKGVKVRLESAEVFGLLYYNDVDRAVAIFRNIIANKGTFKP